MFFSLLTCKYSDGKISYCAESTRETVNSVFSRFLALVLLAWSIDDDLPNCIKVSNIVTVTRSQFLE